MTYCVAPKLNAGLVFLSDSRTNAGLDQISTFRKVMLYEQPGERFMVLQSAGNLSITQSVRELLESFQPHDTTTDEMLTIWNVRSMFDAARVLGAAVRHVHERDATALQRAGVDFNVSMIFGGQIQGEACACSRSIRPATSSRPRARRPTSRSANPSTASPCWTASSPETPLDEAAKCALVSMDSTLKSNLSVGLPLDLIVYENNRFATDRIVCLDADNPYLRMLHDSWGERLRHVFDSIDDRPGTAARPTRRFAFTARVRTRWSRSEHRPPRARPMGWVRQLPARRAAPARGAGSGGPEHGR
jgi:putative proteasome-type protease